MPGPPPVKVKVWTSTAQDSTKRHVGSAASAYVATYGRITQPPVGAGHRQVTPQSPELARRRALATARPPAVPLPEPYPSPFLVPTVLVIVGLLIVAMWWRDTSASSVHGFGGEVTAVGNLMGLIGAYLVLVQILLLARLPWFERGVGLDRLAGWHRALGTNVVIVLVLHASFLTVGYAATSHAFVLAEPLRLFSLFRYIFEAAIALAIFVLVAVTSATAARRRLSYEAWYWIHVGVYAAVVLAIFHQISSGVDFVGHPLNRALWIALYGAVALCVVITRFGRVVLTYLRHRMRVEAVIPEAPNVVSVWIKGHNLDLLGTDAGQFFLWRFIVRGHLSSSHPYSVSTFPDPHRLRITVKTEGDHSGRAGELRPGDRVLAEGPFGHFTIRRRTKLRCLLVAGGSGIAPIRALAEALARTRPNGPGDVIVLYRASDPNDLVFRHELDAMAKRGLLTVHYLVGSRRRLGHDPLSAASLQRLVPDARRRDVWICGPQGMSQAVAKSLARLRVPRRQIHTESFSLW
jgi:predicted ferric reductase